MMAPGVFVGLVECVDAVVVEELILLGRTYLLEYSPPRGV